jgi:sugar-specific transcriptional regulator TrmB
MVVNSVAERLSNLGFSSYEAKAYLALLSFQPATAYELARESRVPTSKIYEVLERLVQRGVARAYESDGKKRYVPQPADDFVESTRENLGRNLDLLKTELRTIGSPSDVSYIWNLSDYPSLIDKATRMIREATNRVLVSAWPSEAEVLAPLLVRADQRGVKTALVLFGHEKVAAPQVFLHPIENTIYEEHGGRGLVVVSDGQQALVGTVQAEEGGHPGTVEGAWSLNRGWVTLAEDYVKHDVYIMKIVHRMDAELVKRFGHNYALLRDIFSDREVE